jgi:O-antigen/teichoic acid export membrane protein
VTSAEAPAVTPEAPQSRRSVWVGAARSGGTRMLVLPVSALLGIVVTRLILENYGTAAFAQYGLLVAIAALLPFADLGISASVLNAVGGSDSPSTDERVRRVLITAVRVAVGAAAVLGVIAALITVLGLWPELLGPGLMPGSGPLAAMLCLLFIAAGIPMGLGQRILIGLRRNHLVILVMGLQTPLVLAVLVTLIWWDVPAGPALAPIAYAATFGLAVVCTYIAARRVRPLLGRALADVPRLRTVRGASIFDTTWPMLIQMIALPIAMQTDRIVLSHRTSTEVLVEYNLAAQMFIPIWGVVSAAGITLWPVFAKARAQGRDDSPVPMSWAFGAAAGVMALAVAIASPFLAELASGGRIELPLLLVLSFTALMVLQGLKYPLGMFMTDAAGLRFQALMIVLMLPVNVGLSWVLAGPLGAAGPVIGSIVGVALFQVLAGYLLVRRRLRSAPVAEATR